MNKKFDSLGNMSMTWASIGFSSTSIRGLGTSYPALLKRSPYPDIGITICVSDIRNLISQLLMAPNPINPIGIFGRKM